jgi:hypothetical protein
MAIITKKNFAGMFLEWTFTKCLFFVWNRNLTWPPPQRIVLTWDTYRKRTNNFFQKLKIWLDPNFTWIDDLFPLQGKLDIENGEKNICRFRLWFYVSKSFLLWLCFYEPYRFVITIYNLLTLSFIFHRKE